MLHGIIFFSVDIIFVPSTDLHSIVYPVVSIALPLFLAKLQTLPDLLSHLFFLHLYRQQ